MRKSVVIPAVLFLFIISCSPAKISKSNVLPYNTKYSRALYFRGYDNFTGRLYNRTSKENIAKRNIRNYTAVFIDKNRIIRKKEWVYLGRNIITEYFNEKGKIAAQIIKDNSFSKKAFFLYYNNFLTKIKVYKNSKFCHYIKLSYDGAGRIIEKRVVDTSGRLTYVYLYYYPNNKVIRKEYSVDSIGTKEIKGLYVALTSKGKLLKDIYYTYPEGIRFIYSARYFDKSGRISKGLLYSKKIKGRLLLKSVYKNGRLYCTYSYYLSGKLKKRVTYSLSERFAYKSGSWDKYHPMLGGIAGM